MEKKIKGGSTSKVIVTSVDGSVQEFTNKELMEKIIATSNEKQWHVTEGGIQLHNNSYITKLGTYGDGK